MDLMDLRQLFREMTEGDFLASQATAALEVISDLRFEISDHKYLPIHVHIAYMVWTLLAASEATTA